jgi:hypothetical protein
MVIAKIQLLILEDWRTKEEAGILLNCLDFSWQPSLPNASRILVFFS